MRRKMPVKQPTPEQIRAPKWYSGRWHLLS
jgi:hypothetical protein